MNNIILFDGECNFCDYSVQFIIKKDKKELYKFASIQSEAGERLLCKFEVPGDVDSLILIEDNKYYCKSTAVLKICKKLASPWHLLYGLIILPTRFRDYFYGVAARNRYNWFGKKESCMFPSPEIRNRFL